MDYVGRGAVAGGACGGVRFLGAQLRALFLLPRLLTSTAAARAAKATLGTATFLAGAEAGRGAAEQRRESMFWRGEKDGRERREE